MSTMQFFTNVLVRTNSLFEALYTTSTIRVFRVQSGENTKMISYKIIIIPPFWKVWNVKGTYAQRTKQNFRVQDEEHGA